jgi:hypothetical protein
MQRLGAAQTDALVKRISTHHPSLLVRNSTPESFQDSLSQSA